MACACPGAIRAPVASATVSKRPPIAIDRTPDPETITALIETEHDTFITNSLPCREGDTALDALICPSPLSGSASTGRIRFAPDRPAAWGRGAPVPRYWRPDR